MAMAGLNEAGTQLLVPKTVVQLWQDLNTEVHMASNIAVCLPELIKCESQLLFSRYKSFSWLKDMRMVALVGMMSE